MQFITVASMPIWSAFTRSISLLVRPRQKFPPPVTIPTSTPASTEIFTCLATSLTAVSSNPVFFGPARASPLNFNNTRFHLMVRLSHLVCLTWPILYHTKHALERSSFNWFPWSETFSPAPLRSGPGWTAPHWPPGGHCCSVCGRYRWACGWCSGTIPWWGRNPPCTPYSSPVWDFPYQAPPGTRRYPRYNPATSAP